MKLPHFDFYPGDWISDTRHLTYEERGAYFDLLCHMWVRGHDCTLPADDRFIAGLLGVSTSKWRQLRLVLVDGVGAVFQITEPGLTNKRLRKEWDKAVTKVQKAKESADARWGTLPNKDANAMRTHSEGNAIEDAMPTECYPEPELKKDLKAKDIERVIPRAKHTPFSITQVEIDWGEQKAWEYGVVLNITLVAEKFTNYYQRGRGKNKAADPDEWVGIWQQWVLKDIESILLSGGNNNAASNNGRQSKGQRNLAHIAKLKAEFEELRSQGVPY